MGKDTWYDSKGLTTGAVGCVSSLAQDAADTEVAATVDVGDGERGLALEGVGEVVECRLVDGALELGGVGEEVEDTGCEVTSQAGSAFFFADVDLEVGAGEGTILDTAAAGATLGVEAKNVLCGQEIDELAVATEASGRGEDLGLVGTHGQEVKRLCVEGPVPVARHCQLIVRMMGT